MTLRDDLIAAKALIDTKEKWEQSFGIFAVIGAAIGICGGNRFEAVNEALAAASPKVQMSRSSRKRYNKPNSPFW